MTGITGGFLTAVSRMRGGRTTGNSTYGAPSIKHHHPDTSMGNPRRALAELLQSLRQIRQGTVCAARPTPRMDLEA